MEINDHDKALIASGEDSSTEQTEQRNEAKIIQEEGHVSNHDLLGKAIKHRQMNTIPQDEKQRNEIVDIDTQENGGHIQFSRPGSGAA